MIVVFILYAFWWRRIRSLWKLPDGIDWLRGKLGLVLMGGALLNKSLIQFSVDGRGCVPFLLFDLRPNYGGGNEDNGDLLQKVPCTHCYTQCLQPAAGHHWPTPLLETPGHSCQAWVSLLWGHCTFLLEQGDADVGRGAHLKNFLRAEWEALQDMGGADALAILITLWKE